MRDEYLPDADERGESRVENWFHDNVRGDIATCSCGKQFKLDEGMTLSPDPYAIPVCPDCFERFA